MHNWDRVPVYDSQGAAYQAAFQTFLDHTDQKDKARGWLDRQVSSLPQRRRFIDAGAGNGKVTAWYSNQFDECVAIEPNPHLRAELSLACPTATVLPQNILEAQPAGTADFILVSHVFYYIPTAAWQDHLAKLASWLSDRGTLVIALQNHDTDCMRMLMHFLGHRFSLTDAARSFAAAHEQAFVAELETVPARILTPNLESACTISAFMLNLLHDVLGQMPERPSRQAIESYLEQHSAQPGGDYRLSCNQDFLVIRRRPAVES